MKEQPTEVGNPKQLPIISQLAQLAIDAGYRVTPVYASGALGAYKEGQDYSDLNDPAWQGASHVGVILDRAVLLDYDANKEGAEGIMPLDELSEWVGGLPEPVQLGSEGLSRHYLFQVPKGWSAGNNLSHSKDNFVPFMDLKTGNQVMHLKPHKQMGELLPFYELPVLPHVLLEPLKTEGKELRKGGGAVLQEAIQRLFTGEGLHGAALTITNSMAGAGQSEVEIRTFFERHRQAILEARGHERTNSLFNGELTAMIETAIVPEVVFEPVVTPWEDWVYVAHDDRFCRLSSSAQLKPAAFNNIKAREDTYVGKRKLTPAKYAIEVANIPTVQYAMYAPQFGRFFTYDNDDCVNTYRPDSVPVAASQWSGLYEKHLRLLFGEDAKIISQWMAWVVRNAGKKVLWALVLKGVEGDGKSLVARMVKAAIGVSNSKEISMADVNSEFTAWAVGKCFGVIEEIRVNGQTRHKVMDKLKPLITNPEIGIIKKGVDGQTVLNTMNYMLLTNHEDALALHEGDRRYGVYFTQFTSREQLPDKEYYDRLAEAIETKPDEVRAWLESIDLSDFKPNSAPAMTEAKQQMIRKSRGQSVDTLAEAIAIGGAGVCEEAFSPLHVNHIITAHYLGKTLNSTTMSKAANTLGYERYNKRIKWQGSPTTAYVKKGTRDTLKNSEIREIWDSITVFEEE